jgi:hypothetical protein
MKLTGKKLLVLTGSNGARDAIDYARKSGVFTLATDYHRQSDEKSAADLSFEVSTDDIEGVYGLAKKHRVDRNSKRRVCSSDIF